MDDSYNVDDSGSIGDGSGGNIPANTQGDSSGTGIMAGAATLLSGALSLGNTLAANDSSTGATTPGQQAANVPAQKPAQMTWIFWAGLAAIGALVLWLILKK